LRTISGEPRRDLEEIIAGQNGTSAAIPQHAAPGYLGPKESATQLAGAIARQRRPGERSHQRMLRRLLFLAHQAEAGSESSALAPRKNQRTATDVVHRRRILAAGQIHDSQPHRPFVPQERKTLFHAYIDGHEGRKPQLRRRTDELAVLVYKAKWESCPILHAIAEQQLPDRGGSPAVGKNPVWSIPGENSGNLGSKQRARERV